MPSCSHCGKPVDCPNHAHVVGSVSQSCPLTRGVVWLWVVDEDGVNMEGAKVTFDGREGTTDASGVATYDPVTVRSDAYPVAVTEVPSGRKKTRGLPTVATGEVSALGAQVVTKKFILRKLKPKIEVVPSHNFKKVVGSPHPATLAIKNVGEADLTLGDIVCPTHFEVDPANTVVRGAVIAPAASVDLKIRYVPPGAGVHQGDLTVASDDPAGRPEVVALKGQRVTPVLELYRGGRTLPLVPFATTDMAAHLDSPLPDLMHDVAADTRDPSLDASFKFPEKTEYGTHAAADGDPSVFRLRLKDMPDAAPDEVTVTVKVLRADKSALPGVSGFAHGGTAGAAGGMPVVFKKNVAVWESPYMRVATTVVPVLNKGTHSTIVHSATAATVAVEADTRQFGRILEATCTVGSEAVAGEFTMGGEPYAKVPIQFYAVGWAGAPLKPLAKLAELNQYWAGHGLEFVLKDALTPLKAVLALPARLQLSFNEHRGAALFTDHDVRVEVTLTFDIGGGTERAVVSADIAANATSVQAANAVKSALTSWRGAGPASGVRFDGDVLDFPAPRVVLQSPSGSVARPLTVIGARGPTDLAVKETTGAAVTHLAIAGVAATREVVVPAVIDPLSALPPPLPTVRRDPDTSVDVFSPPLDGAFHDPACNPPSAAMRAWVRAFGSAGRDHVSVIITDRVAERPVTALCQAGLSTIYDGDDTTLKGRMDPAVAALASTTSPISILNFGRWTEPQAHFVIFLGRANFAPGSNDLQHEVGHTLADYNHTLEHPTWYYRYELMHASGPREGKANQMTRHKIKVDGAVDAGGWKADYIELASGYPGAARARIARLAGGWLHGGSTWPWT